MKVTVIVVGKAKGDVGAAVADYEARAAHYWKFEAVEVDGGASGRDPAPDRVMAAEAERILSRVPEGTSIFALTREGKGMGSSALARALGDHAVRSSPGVTFVIGGAFGLAPEVLKRATRKLSLSAMTLPHEMARLVLAEQLYRAGTILRGEPYHKGA